MAKKDLFLPLGVATEDKKGGFNLTEWFIKKVAKRFGIAFRDECCDGNNDGFPVRISEDLSSLEYFDGTAWVLYGVLVTESTTTTTTTI